MQYYAILNKVDANKPSRETADGLKNKFNLMREWENS